jgi:sodium/proline symporter
VTPLYCHQNKAACYTICQASKRAATGYLGTQVQAMGIVMNTIFGVSPKVGAIIGLVILAAYAVGGGMIAGVYTDVVQGLIMIIVSLFVFVYAIQAGGGMLEITKTLQEAEPLMASPTGMFPIMTVVCWLFLMSFGMAGQPQLITKFLMVKNVKELKWGAFTACLAYLITILLVVGIGLSAAALTIKGEFPSVSSADETLTTFLLEYTPPVIAGLVLSGLLAAIMSTGDSFVNLGAACIVRDFPKAFKVKVKNELLWSRLAVVGLLVASALFAFYMNTLVGLLGVFGFGTFASALFPVIVLGLLWEKATTKGAIASIIVALASNFILEIGAKYGLKLLPPGVINGAFAFVLSIIVFITVSLFTYSEKEKVSEEMKEIIQG